MAHETLTGGLLAFDGYNLSRHARQVVLTFGAETHDDTTLADETRARIGGLKDASLGASGFFEAPSPDSILFTDVALVDKVILVASKDDEGSIGYAFKAAVGEYQPFGGNVGEIAAFNLRAAVSANKLIRGTLALNGTRGTSGNGTAYQLGTAAAAQKLWAALQVLSVSGTNPSLTVKVQSDNGSGFSSPTDQITFTAATAAGAQFGSAAGPITDDWFRPNLTISGTNPVFVIALLVGVHG